MVLTGGVYEDICKNMLKSMGLSECGRLECDHHYGDFVGGGPMCIDFGFGKLQVHIIYW